MWAIDEYARIFRSCVWLRPPQPPARTDIIAMVTNKFGFIDGEIWYRTDKGVIFCQVSRIIPDDSGIPWVTSGTQKWKGNSPNLIARAIVIMFDAIGLGYLILFIVLSIVG